MYGAFAPAGEVPMTVAAIFGVPSPIHDTGGDWNNALPREVGTVSAPQMTGSTVEAAPVPAAALSSQKTSALIDPSHEVFWLLILGVGLLGLVHFDVGGSARVRAGRGR